MILCAKECLTLKMKKCWFLASRHNLHGIYIPRHTKGNISQFHDMSVYSKVPVCSMGLLQVNEHSVHIWHISCQLSFYPNHSISSYIAVCCICTLLCLSHRATLLNYIWWNIPPRYRHESLICSTEIIKPGLDPDALDLCINITQQHTNYSNVDIYFPRLHSVM